MTLARSKRGNMRVKITQLRSEQPPPPDVGPVLWRAFGKRLASARLTGLQKGFVTEYLGCLTGAKAARRAGYSSNRARQQAYDNLRKPKIKRLIERGLYLQDRDWNVRMGYMRPDARRIPRGLRYKT
jgi:hypothetical protein